MYVGGVSGHVLCEANLYVCMYECVHAVSMYVSSMETVATKHTLICINFVNLLLLSSALTRYASLQDIL